MDNFHANCVVYITIFKLDATILLAIMVVAHVPYATLTLMPMLLTGHGGCWIIGKWFPNLFFYVQ